MRVKQLLALSILPVLAVTATGCGGSSDDSNKQLSYSAFISEANKICKDTNAKLKSTAQPQDVKGIADYVDQQKQVIEPAIQDLKDLKPPPELQSAYDEFLSKTDALAAKSDELKSAAQANDQQKLQQIGQEGDQINKQSDAAATKAGLTECAKN